MFSLIINFVCKIISIPFFLAKVLGLVQDYFVGEKYSCDPSWLFWRTTSRSSYPFRDYVLVIGPFRIELTL